MCFPNINCSNNYVGIIIEKMCDTSMQKIYLLFGSMLDLGEGTYCGQFKHFITCKGVPCRGSTTKKKTKNLLHVHISISKQGEWLSRFLNEIHKMRTMTRLGYGPIH